jgi:hypothetical protein
MVYRNQKNRIEGLNMKKLFMLILPIGIFIFAMVNICYHLMHFSDYIKGFFEGMSGVFIVVGLIILISTLIDKNGKRA